MRDSIDSLESAPRQSERVNVQPAIPIDGDEASPEALVAAPPALGPVAVKTDLIPMDKSTFAVDVSSEGETIQDRRVTVGRTETSARRAELSRGVAAHPSHWAG